MKVIFGARLGYRISAILGIKFKLRIRFRVAEGRPCVGRSAARVWSAPTCRVDVPAGART